MKKRTALLIAVVLIILLIGFSTSIAIHFYHSSNNIEALCSACWRGDLDAAIRILRVQLSLPYQGLIPLQVPTNGVAKSHNLSM